MIGSAGVLAHAADDVEAARRRAGRGRAGRRRARRRPRPRERRVAGVGLGDVVAAAASGSSRVPAAVARSSSTISTRVMSAPRAGDRQGDDERSRRRPGCRPGEMVPPMASTKPRAMARPRPDAGAAADGVVVAALEGREDALRRSSGGMPGPRSITRSSTSSGVRAGGDADLRAGRGVAQRVLDEVGDDAFEQARRRRGPRAGRPGRRRRRSRRRRGVVERPADDVVEPDRRGQHRTARRPAGGTGRAGWSRGR